MICASMTFAAGDSTNAVDNLLKQSNGLGWTAPDVLAGEPALTGYTIYWGDTDVQSNAVELVSFDLTTNNVLDIVGTTNEYYWTEYPLPIPDDGMVKKWFWVTASNDTGAESEYSDPATITMDTRKPAKPMNLFITSTTNGLSVSVENVPSDVDVVKVDISEDLLKWVKGAEIGFARSAVN